MKSIIWAAGLAIGLAGAASAQDADWSGFYLGGSHSFTDGPLDVYDNGTLQSEFEWDGSNTGIIAGYSVQRGQLVFGAEAAYSVGPVSDDNDGVELDNFIDLKGRAGYAFGRVLAYGVLGWSQVDITEVGSDTTTKMDGLNYGIGVDFAMTDRIFLGAEYLVRDLEGKADQTEFPGTTLETDARSLSLRAGYRF